MLGIRHEIYEQIISSQNNLDKINYCNVIDKDQDTKKLSQKIKSYNNKRTLHHEQHKIRKLRAILISTQLLLSK